VALAAVWRIKYWGNGLQRGMAERGQARQETPVESGGWCFPLADQDSSNKNPNEDRTCATNPPVVSTKVTSLRPHSLSKAEFELFS